MKNKIYFCLIIATLNAQDSKQDIAFEKVMNNIKGSVPESFVRNAFKHKKVKIYNLTKFEISKKLKNRPCLTATIV